MREDVVHCCLGRQVEVVGFVDLGVVGGFLVCAHATRVVIHAEQGSLL